MIGQTDEMTKKVKAKNNLLRLDDALIVKTEKLKTITFSLGTGNYSIISKSM